MSKKLSDLKLTSYDKESLADLALFETVTDAKYAIAKFFRDRYNLIVRVMVDEDMGCIYITDKVDMLIMSFKHIGANNEIG